MWIVSTTPGHRTKLLSLWLPIRSIWIKLGRAGVEPLFVKNYFAYLLCMGSPVRLCFVPATSIHTLC